MAYAGNFELQLAEKWECREKRCMNLGGYCYPDPDDSSAHFNITHVQMKQWAQSIERGEGLVFQPPYSMLTWWRRNQGPITRDSKAPIRKTFQQEARENLQSIGTTIGSLEQQLQESRLQNMLAAEVAIRENTELDLQRRRREEEDRAAAEDREEKLRVAAEEREERRQRKLEEMELRKQLTWQQHGLNKHPPHSLHPQLSQSHTALYPRMPQSYSAHPPLAASSYYQQPPLPQAAPEILATSRKSSPISEAVDEVQVLASFAYKIQGNLPGEADKWERASHIVTQQDWSIDDLKNMEDGRSAMYHRAIAAGISDGMARRFASELRKYKPVHRRTEAEASLLVPPGGFFQ